jgi:hypothetical protein
MTVTYQNQLGAHSFDLPPESRWLEIEVPIYDPVSMRSSARCRCSCGTWKTVLLSNLSSGKTVSCGCFRRDWASDNSRTHGRSKTPEHGIWLGIKRRCLDPTNPAYDRYGGRGITICERWLQFENFYADMGPRPEPSLSIDRVKNDLGYSPDNCIWATRKEQANNTRRNVILTHNGQTMTASQWVPVVGISSSTITQRKRVLDWTDERTLTQPERKLPKRANDTK